jgi:hypothetical protein
MSLLRDGPVRRRSAFLRCVRLAALGAALIAVLFVASGAAIWHFDAPGSLATCPICHLAHMPALRAAHGAIVALRITIAWVVPTDTRLGHAPTAALHAPPRAPPA